MEGESGRGGGWKVRVGGEECGGVRKGRSEETMRHIPRLRSIGHLLLRLW